MRTRRSIGITLLVVLVLVMLAVLPAAAQSDQSPRLLITDVDTSQYPQVSVYLAATDGALPDPQAIQLVEDTRQITQTNTITSNVGVDVAFVISLRRSMRAPGLLGGTRLNDARQIADYITLAMTRDDLISVFGFSRYVVPISVTQPLTDGGGFVNAVFRAPGQLRDFDAARVFASSDEHAYSALSSAILSATRELSATTPIGLPGVSQDTIPAKLRRQLKLIIVFSDSCDDLDSQLTPPKQQSCAVPSQVERALRAQGSRLAIVAVGLGSDNTQQTRPAPADAGYSYVANYELLKKYADRFFFQLDPSVSQSPQIQKDRVQQAITQLIAARRTQLVVTYTSHVGNDWPHNNHQIKLTAAGQELRQTFGEPLITPTIELTNTTNALRPVITNNQSPIASATYYRDGAPLTSTLALPFELLWDDISAQSITSTITLSVTLKDGRTFSALGSASIPVKSSSTESALNRDKERPKETAPSWQLYALMVLSLLALALLIASWLARRAALPRPTMPVEPIRAPDYALATVPDRKTVHLLRPGQTVIGSRREGADIHMSLPDVADEHAIVTARADGRLEVEDRGSLSGTFINNARLAPKQPTLLNEGDLLTIGRTTLKCIRLDAAAQPTPVNAPAPVAMSQPNPPATREAGV